MYVCMYVCMLSQSSRPEAFHAKKFSSIKHGDIMCKNRLTIVTQKTIILKQYGKFRVQIWGIHALHTYHACTCKINVFHPLRNVTEMFPCLPQEKLNTKC